MRNIDIVTKFETEIGLIDEIFEKPVTDDSLYWINQSINKFVKLRFNGDLVHKTSVEQTEKRNNDLRRLFKKFDASEFTVVENTNYDSYSLNYPNDFLYALNEDVVICDNDDLNDYGTFVFECTRDSFMPRINNSLTDFHYNYGKARPIRIKTESGCELYTDKNYKIKKYTLGYIKTPSKVTLETIELAKSEYTDFDDSTLYEIIKIAALMFLENTKNERYKTISEEVLTQE